MTGGTGVSPCRLCQKRRNRQRKSRQLQPLPSYSHTVHVDSFLFLRRCSVAVTKGTRLKLAACTEAQHPSRTIARILVYTSAMYTTCIILTNLRTKEKKVLQ